MNQKVRLAVLKLLALKEEFSGTDLEEAARLVFQENFDPFASSKSDSDGLRRRRAKTKRIKAIDEIQSKVIADLRDRDPERFELLDPVDKLLRAGKLLPRHEDIRRFGAALDKGYESGKSRKESIPRLMKLLAEQPLEELRRHLQALMRQTPVKGVVDSEYQQLANFLMTGKSQ